MFEELAKNYRILIGKKRFLVRDLDKDFHTNYGTFYSEDLKKVNTYIKTNKGKEFFITIPNFYDLYSKIKRKPQIIPLKDVAYIIARTGVNIKTTVVDAGTGSGALAIMLALIAGKVYSYDVRDDHIEVARKNRDFFGLDNLEIKKHDVYTGIPQKDVDLITLDLPEPWRVLGFAYESLKPNSYLVSYSPTIPQVMDFVDSAQASKGFIIEDVLEILERKWEVHGRVVRPSTFQLHHSGFLVFARKIVIE